MCSDLYVKSPLYVSFTRSEFASRIEHVSPIVEMDDPFNVEISIAQDLTVYSACGGSGHSCRSRSRVERPFINRRAVHTYIPFTHASRLHVEDLLSGLSAKLQVQSVSLGVN